MSRGPRRQLKTPLVNQEEEQEVRTSDHQQGSNDVDLTMRGIRESRDVPLTSIDETRATNEEPPRRIGLGWFRGAPQKKKGSSQKGKQAAFDEESPQTDRQKVPTENANIGGPASEGSESRYYGGIMKSANDSTKRSKHTLSPRGAKNLFRTISWQRTTTDVTIHDFDDKEWTPQDSSYGAACPVCGCIPKTFRRAIEFTLVAAALVGMVYLVVTSSIRITNDRRVANSASDNSGTSSSYNGGGHVDLDDDRYEAYKWHSNKNNDDLGTAYDDDDKFNGNDGVYFDDDYTYTDDDTSAYYAGDDDDQ